MAVKPEQMNLSENNVIIMIISGMPGVGKACAVCTSYSCLRIRTRVLCE